jgi:hypothetical protein
MGIIKSLLTYKQEQSNSNHCRAEAELIDGEVINYFIFIYFISYVKSSFFLKAFLNAIVLCHSR